MRTARIDWIVEVLPDEEAGVVLMIARREGLLIGLSSGAVVSAFTKVRNIYNHCDYVSIFPDDVFKNLEIFDEYFSRKSGSKKILCQSYLLNNAADKFIY